jgi:membrane-associated phospholipid phosphatase
MYIYMLPSSYSQAFSIIGRYGPVILFFSSLVALAGKEMTRRIYIAGFIVNILLNSVLKILIKQKRPNKDKSDSLLSSLMDTAPEAEKEKVKSVHRYGMPSGHAQTIAYSLGFVALTVNNLYVISAFLLLTVTTCIQRVLWNRHYVDQVVVGCATGIAMAYLAVKIKTKLMEHESRGQ